MEHLEANHHPLHTIKREKWIIFLLAFMQFAHILDFVIMMPLGPFFMKEFQINTAEFGLLVSAYTFSAGVFGFLGAFYLDRYDRKLTLISVFGGFSVGTLLCGIAPDYYTLLIARVVAGGFGGIIGAVVLSIIGDIVPVFRRGAATGVVMSAFSVASVVGIPVGLFLAERFGWHIPFLSLGALSLVFIPLAYKTLPEMRLHLEDAIPKSPMETMILLFTRKSHFYSFAFVTCLMFGGFSVIPFIAPYLTSNVGLSVSDLTWMYFFGGIATFFTSRIIGKLSDLYGKPRVFRIVAVLSMVPVLALTHLPVLPVWQVLVVMVVFMVFVSGRIVPAFAMITSSVDASYRGSFMSASSSVQQLASAAASLIAGAILVKAEDGTLLHYDWVGYIAVSASVLTLFLSKKFT